MFTQEEKKIIHEVALNHFASDYVVEDVILFIEHEVARIIESADVKNEFYPTIGLINFGKFCVSDKKRRYLKQDYDKRHKDINGREENISERTGSSEKSTDLGAV